MFNTGDLDKNGELTFQEFTVCYNNILKYRDEHNLEAIDVSNMVANYLENHKDLQVKAGARHASLRVLESCKLLGSWPFVGVYAVCE